MAEPPRPELRSAVPALQTPLWVRGGGLCGESQVFIQCPRLSLGPTYTVGMPFRAATPSAGGSVDGSRQWRPGNERQALRDSCYHTGSGPTTSTA